MNFFEKWQKIKKTGNFKRKIKRTYVENLPYLIIYYKKKQKFIDNFDK